MTITIETLYPTPLRQNGYIESYKEHAPEFKIPQKTIDNEIAALVKRIEATPGFDPNMKFDAKRHLVFEEKSYKETKTFTLDDLKIHKTHIPRINNFGAAFPFKLLSQEAVNLLLWEALQPKVLEQHARLPNPSLSKNSTRLDFHVGSHVNLAPFTNSICYSKELAEICSNFVGYKLEPIWQSDVVQVNVSLASTDPEEIYNNYPQTQEEIDRQLAVQDASDGQNIPSSVSVHYDSITVPLVIMLELPEEAQGGQTTIITGDETATRVPEPPVGSGTLIQGRVLRHLASKPVTNHNRVSFVISYSTGVKGELDNCVITSLRPSVLPKNEFNKFYRDWAEYKLSKLENHLKFLKEEVIEKYNESGVFDQPEFVEKCVKIEKYVRGIYGEMECVENKPFPPPSYNQPYSEL